MMAPGGSEVTGRSGLAWAGPAEGASARGTTGRRAPGLCSRLVLGATVATGTFIGGCHGHVRRAFADCTGDGGVYTCSGATATTQTLVGEPLTVTTDDTFGITTTTGDAFTLEGAYGIDFEDAHSSTISGAGDGIDAVNYSGGPLSITVSGRVIGTGGPGIYALNSNAYGLYAVPSDGDLTIDAVDVSGGTDGIYAVNQAGGALTITARGTVTGKKGAGIYARNDSAGTGPMTAVTVEEGASANGSTVGIEIVSATGRAASVVNAGSITGAKGILASTSGTVTITNSGSIAGTGGTAIDLAAAGSGTINQRGGTIDGDVLLSSGADVVDVSGGNIDGNVIGGAGSDSVVVSGGSISGGIEAEHVELYGGSVGGDITGLSNTTLVIDDSKATAPLVLSDGVLFSGTNAVGTITDTDLAHAAGNTFRTQNFAGFSELTLSNSTLGFSNSTETIGQLNVDSGSTLFVDPAVTLLSPLGGYGNLDVNNSTLSFINGSPADVLTVGNLTLSGATIGVDVNQQTGQSDRLVANGGVSASGNNTILVNLLSAPNFLGPTQFPILTTSGAVDPASFTVSGISGTPASLFNYSVVPGASGGLFLLATPNPQTLPLTLATPAAINSGAAFTALEAFSGITNDAAEFGLGLATGSAPVQAASDFGVFASGQWAHVNHDGFHISDGPVWLGPEFASNDFSAAISLDFNAARRLEMDKRYGLDIGLFGGYTSTDVSYGPFLGFRSVGNARNRSGMAGLYSLFRWDRNYVLVSGTTFIGDTRIDNGVLDSTGRYDTIGYAGTASIGHIFALSERTNFDLRGGVLGVTFAGDDFTDSQGNAYGRSRLSFGAFKFEPGIYGIYKLANGMVLSPYARAELQQRFGYENKASISGIAFNFDDSDFSAGLSAGFNLKLSRASTLSAEIRGKASSDSRMLAGKVGFKVSF